mmetsp:Transcript_27351/g.82062  ORF Transcript_27351/g.82062 Transcript_27351/m.82062 type:complete len:217 (-) Transcript_27351:849-1499(-)
MRVPPPLQIVLLKRPNFSYFFFLLVCCLSSLERVPLATSSHIDGLRNSFDASSSPFRSHVIGRNNDNYLRLEEQTWHARQIEQGYSHDITLDWAELRNRVSMTDARLLLRTTALDLAIRERFVVFDLGVLKGYVDCDRCVLLLPVHADNSLKMLESTPKAVGHLFSSREHIARVEANVVDALSRHGGRRLSFAMIVVECALEEVWAHLDSLCQLCA